VTCHMTYQKTPRGTLLTCQVVGFKIPVWEIRRGAISESYARSIKFPFCKSIGVSIISSISQDVLDLSAPSLTCTL
jgi:hypothetical protein